MDTKPDHERQDCYYNKLIEQILPLIRDMSDTQLDKLESIIKAELWDRNNQPNGNIFNQETG